MTALRTAAIALVLGTAPLTAQQPVYRLLATAESMTRWR